MNLSKTLEKTFSKFTALDMTKLGIDLRYEVGKDVKEFIQEIRTIILSNSSPYQKLKALDEKAGKKLK